MFVVRLRFPSDLSSGMRCTLIPTPYAPNLEPQPLNHVFATQGNTVEANKHKDKAQKMAKYVELLQVSLYVRFVCEH